MGGTSAGPQLLPVTGYLDAAAQRLLSFGGDDLSRVQVLVSSLPWRRNCGRRWRRPPDGQRSFPASTPCAGGRARRRSRHRIRRSSCHFRRASDCCSCMVHWRNDNGSTSVRCGASPLNLPHWRTSCRLLPCCCRTIWRPCAASSKSLRPQGSAPLAFEARIVHEMWHVLAGVGRPDAPAAYRLRLSALARSADCPFVRPSRRLAGRALGRGTRVSRAFAERQSVEVVAPCPRESGTRRWRKCWRLRGLPCPTLSLQRPQVQVRLRKPPHGRRCATGRGNSVPGSSSAPSRKAFTVCRKRSRGRGRSGGCASILLARRGLRRIALVAEDRLTARRVRALLERQQVLVADETGWKLTTTRAAATVDALLECAPAALTIATCSTSSSPASICRRRCCPMRGGGTSHRTGHATPRCSGRHRRCQACAGRRGRA